MNKLQRFKAGMKNLTPMQLIQGKMIGHAGNCFGLIFAGVFLALRGFWYFLIFIGFSAYLEVVNYIQTKQMLDQMKKIQKEMEG